nr:hypothetical protein [uncultured Butyrivibrio sp.]
MLVYKLFRVKDGKLYPLYVEADREMALGVWLKAHVGELADPTHVKSAGCGGRLSLRPGFHSTSLPFTNWIGRKMPDGTLAQRANSVWCECEIRGSEVSVTERNGSRTIVDGYYKFKTNSKQKEPWFISSEIKINRILTQNEVKTICAEKGVKAQMHESEYNVSI